MFSLSPRCCVPKSSVVIALSVLLARFSVVMEDGSSCYSTNLTFLFFSEPLKQSLKWKKISALTSLGGVEAGSPKWWPPMVSPAVLACVGPRTLSLLSTLTESHW